MKSDEKHSQIAYEIVNDDNEPRVISECQNRHDWKNAINSELNSTFDRLL